MSDEMRQLINTYPEMNKTIVKILEESNRPHLLYAAARIKELEREREGFLDTMKAMIKACKKFHRGTIELMDLGFIPADENIDLMLVTLENAVDITETAIEKAERK